MFLPLTDKHAYIFTNKYTNERKIEVIQYIDLF